MTDDRQEPNELTKQTIYESDNNINVSVNSSASDIIKEVQDEIATNPKDAIGAKKPNLALIPMSALPGIALCMENGASKYGPYNWRDKDKKVGYMTYLAASLRHIVEYIDGLDYAYDSGFHELDHAISSLMVLRDAQINGNAIDDRPPKGKSGDIIENEFQRRLAEAKQ